MSMTIDTVWTKFVATHSAALRDELITAYMPLVRFVVARLGIPPTSMLEFATARIHGAVIDQLRVLNWLPRSAVSRVRQIEATLASLEQLLGRPPTEKEAASELGISVERYRQLLLEANITILSLDASLNSLMHDDEVTTLSELLEDQRTPDPAEQIEKNELTAFLTTAVENLPPRERLLLSLYYQEELTMKEISRILEVSESRVCQLHVQAIMRLRGALSPGLPAKHASSSRGANAERKGNRGKATANVLSAKPYIALLSYNSVPIVLNEVIEVHDSIYNSIRKNNK